MTSSDRAGGRAPTRRPGGVQPIVLTVDDVVDAALSIVHRSGLASLTVRAVTEELGVTAPALYHHVPGGKQALIDLVVERVVARSTPTTDASSPDRWDDALEQLVLSAAAVEPDYPGVLGYLMSTGGNHPASIGVADRAFRILVDGADLEPVDAARAVRVLVALVAGWAQHQLPTAEAARRSGRDDLAAALASAAHDDPADVLRLGVRAMLDGIPRSVP